LQFASPEPPQVLGFFNAVLSALPVVNPYRLA